MKKLQKEKFELNIFAAIDKNQLKINRTTLNHVNNCMLIWEKLKQNLENLVICSKFNRVVKNRKENFLQLKLHENQHSINWYRSRC